MGGEHPLGDTREEEWDEEMWEGGWGGGGNYWTAPPQSSQGLNYQLKSTYGETHSSNLICNRGWPCLTSVGGEALGLFSLFQEDGMRMVVLMSY